MRSPTEVVVNLAVGGAEPEVYQLYLFIFGDEDILEFDISVYNIFAMQIG